MKYSLIHNLTDRSRFWCKSLCSFFVLQLSHSVRHLSYLFMFSFPCFFLPLIFWPDTMFLNVIRYSRMTSKCSISTLSSCNWCTPAWLKADWFVFAMLHKEPSDYLSAGKDDSMVDVGESSLRSAVVVVVLGVFFSPAYVRNASGTSRGSGAWLSSKLSFIPPGPLYALSWPTWPCPAQLAATPGLHSLTRYGPATPLDHRGVWRSRAAYQITLV